MMKRAVLTQLATISVEQADRPVPGRKQVLVEVEVCGVCGSDLHIYCGDHPVIKPPAVMGHEFCGQVVEVGAGVTQFAPGDYVAVIPGVGCGECAFCRSGDFNRCYRLQVIGGHLPGGFAQYAIVPEDNLIKVPSQFSPVEGAMIESVAVAVHAVRRLGEVKNQTFAVLGAGPIGLLTIQVLKAYGARMVAASDPVEGRRALARRLGADVTVDPRTEHLEDIIRRIDPLGLDGAFDCAGLEATLAEALTVTRNGGKVVTTAIYGKNPTIPMRLLQRGERQLIGTQMYVRRDFESAIRLMKSGQVRVEELVTHRFPLEKTADAFRLGQNGDKDIGKIMIEVKTQK